MDFTDLITELKNLTTTESIIIIGLCVVAGLLLLAIITMTGLIITCIATAGKKNKTRLRFES